MHFDAKTSEYFLELLRSVLHNRPAQPKPQDVSWNDLFEFAKSHSLSYMAYYAIRESGFTLGDKLEREWTTRNSRTLVSCFNQDYECSRLCKEFSDAGIRNIPLKGSQICKLYPEPEMREMCDLDILVQPEDLERVHQMMLADGYSYMEEHTTSHNREYHKLPYLNVEVHNYLIPRENPMFSYYENYWDKVPGEDNSLTSRMSWNDCYVFMIAHTYKHFFRVGTGIRSILDIYVMREQLKDVLDRAYIAGELEKLGILVFAENFERLAACWFGAEKAEVPAELQQYHYRVLESGTYGDNSLITKVLKLMQGGKTFRAAKRKMAIAKVFPSYAYMKSKFPSLKYVPFLLPIYWVIRWIKTMIAKPKRIRASFKALWNLSLPGTEKEGK